ncbi:MAG: TPM domain-containing protein [Terrimicrobiaceae bacterium]
MKAFAILGLCLAAWPVSAQESPSKPATYVVDQAGVIPADAESRLEQKLAAFDKETSTQVLVATFPKVPEGFVMEDFTQRTAESWGVGRKDVSNGAVLFLFPEDRQLRIEVGYGLEGALPDITASQIIQNEIVPALRGGDLPGGLERGVEAILAATRGEYQGQPTATAEPMGAGIIILAFVILLLFVIIQNSKGGILYGPGGARPVSSWGSWGGGSGRSIGGGGFSSGGGRFSGGGGSFGGGGASGRW